MQLKKTTISPSRVKLTLSADQAYLDPVKMNVLRHLSQQHLKLPGFRAGKAPLSLVEKHVDPSQLESEFLDEAMTKMYRQAIEAESLRPIGSPQVNLKKFVPFTDLEIDIEVDVIGEIGLPNYRQLKKTSPKVAIDAKQVNAVVEDLRTRLAERTEVNRPAKDGDEITIDFKGTDDKGKPLAGGDGTDYPLILGSNSFIPGFEPQLIGLKPGDSKTISVTFPKDYTAQALQGQKATFEVTVKKVNEVVKPKVDDDLAVKASPFKTLTELKADIKKQLTVENQKQADRDFENILVQELAAKTKVEIPSILIDEQVSRAEESEKQDLMYRGQTWQEHLKEEGVTEQEHRDRNRASAAEAVKAGLMLSEIAQREKISVSPEELEIRLQLLKGQYTDPKMQLELDKEENRTDISNRILTEKTLAKLVEYAQT